MDVHMDTGLLATRGTAKGGKKAVCGRGVKRPEGVTDDPEKVTCRFCRSFIKDDRPRPKPSPLHVWVVHTEWERACDGSNSVVDSVHLSEETAVDASRAVTRELMAAPYYRTPYIDPDTGENTPDWDFDVHVTECEVRP